MTTQTAQHDAQLIEEFMDMIRRDAPKITDPAEMIAMARLILHVLADDQ